MKIERVNSKYLEVTFKTMSFIILLVIVAQVIFSIRYAQTEEKRQLKELNSTILSYQYNISEKLSILTSSNTFIDFLRSGELSRQSKSLDVEILFSNFKDDTIEGVSIHESNGNKIFGLGSPSNLQTTLKICYLNDFLDSKLGSCRHSLKIFFSVDQLVSRLKTMNPNIEVCKTCSTQFEINKNSLGSFEGEFSGKEKLPISLVSSNGLTNIVLFELIILIFLIVIFFIIHRSFGRISQDYIYSPLKGIVGALNSGQPIDLSKVSIFEIKFLGEAINNFITNSRDQEKLRRSASLGQMATQVAHDIRSPLEMLKSIKEEIAPLPEDSRRRIQMSINRIEEITFNLLKTNKHDQAIFDRDLQEELLGLVSSVITEKNIEYKNHNGLEIITKFDSKSFGLFSRINRNSLKSIISNIINNAIDSFSNQPGNVWISLQIENDQNVLRIINNGVSIKDEERSKIFTRGFTTKKNGNGIGLFNAKQDLEATGGSIQFESDVDGYTTFIISLPRCDTPKLFIGSINGYNYERIIILDDDPAFHEVWSKRLAGLASKVEHIHSVEEMFSKYHRLNPNILLLSDFELMDKQMDGIDTILKLGHSEHSVLVTARNEEKAIQDRCLAAGIKLLPKSLVNFVKVVTENPASFKLGSNGEADGLYSEDGISFVDTGQKLTLEAQDTKAQNTIVLIDDDRLIHLNWNSYCKNNGFQFHGFKSIAQFIAFSTGIDKGSKIYIDSNLEDGIKGEIESEKIFALGFLNLYLATGYEKGSIQKPAWIKEIYSKSPENIS
jgi:signal transduction histidine kinase/FixJ family two-component response regulator